MSRTHRVRRLERAVRALAGPAAAPAPPPDEPGELVRELARAFAAAVDQHRTGRGPAADQPDPAAPPPAWFADALLAKPPEEVTFLDLDRLARADPARAAERWEAVKAAAECGVAGGWHAARAVEPPGGSAWGRAVFLAVRGELRRAWPPRHPGEAMLLDQMAQYEVLRRAWLGVLALHSADPAPMPDRRHRGGDAEPRRLSAAEATREAVTMVERLQRLFQAALRALLAARRPRGAVFVRSSSGVNVAVGRQLNVTGRPPVFDGPPAGCDNASPPAAVEA